MFKRIDHAEIVAADATKTIEFYTNVLGFAITSRIKIEMPPMREVIYLQLGDTVIEIIDVDSPSAKSEEPWQVGYKAIALEVTDMDKAVSHLRAHEVVINREPVDLGDSIRGEFLDPDGLVIELRQWKQRD